METEIVKEAEDYVIGPNSDKYAQMAFLDFCTRVSKISNGIRVRLEEITNDKSAIFCTFLKCGKAETCFSCTDPNKAIGIANPSGCDFSKISLPDLKALAKSCHFYSCEFFAGMWKLKLNFRFPLSRRGGLLYPLQIDENHASIADVGQSEWIKQLAQEMPHCFFRRMGEKNWECYDKEKVNLYLSKYVSCEHADKSDGGGRNFIVSEASQFSDVTEFTLLPAKTAVPSHLNCVRKYWNPIPSEQKTLEQVRAEFGIMPKARGEDIYSLLRSGSHKGGVIARLRESFVIIENQIASMSMDIYVFSNRTNTTDRHESGFLTFYHLGKWTVPGNTRHLRLDDLEKLYADMFFDDVHNKVPFNDRERREWCWIEEEKQS